MDDDILNQSDNSADDIEDESVEHEGESLVPELDEDNDTPFSPPTDPVSDDSADLDVREESGELNPAHQTTDNATVIDSQQLYDEGLAGAAEAEEPNAGNAVVDYDPDKDERVQ